MVFNQVFIQMYFTPEDFVYVFIRLLSQVFIRDAPGISEKDENRSKSTKVTKVNTSSNFWALCPHFLDTFVGVIILSEITFTRALVSMLTFTVAGLCFRPKRIAKDAFTLVRACLSASMLTNINREAHLIVSMCRYYVPMSSGTMISVEI